MPSSASPATTSLHSLSLHDALPISTTSYSYFVFTFCFFFLLSLSWFALSKGNISSPTLPSPLPFQSSFPFLFASLFQYSIQDWEREDRKSTRLNSSHLVISYAVFCFSCHHLPPLSFPTRRSSDLHNFLFLFRFYVLLFFSPFSQLVRSEQRKHFLSHSPFSSSLPEFFPLPLRLTLPVFDPGLGKGRSEEHTSELQSPCNLVCRLLLLLPPPPSTLFPYTTLFRSPQLLILISFLRSAFFFSFLSVGSL